MQILHNPRCQKSRATLDLLKENGLNPEIIEYLKKTPTKDELKSIIKKLDVSVDKIIRKEEKQFKENYKGKEFADDEWFQILSKNPKLIQRPIVISGDQAVIGRPPENVKELL